MSKRDISYFNFSTFNSPNPNKESLAAFRANASWMLPQLIALLGSKLPLKRNEDGKVSPTLTLRALKEAEITFNDPTHIVSLPTLAGMFNIICAAPRGDILPVTWKQNTVESARYNTSVPLFLSAFKEFRDIQYSDWDFTDPNIKFFLDKDFLELVEFNNVGWVNPFSNEDLLHYRELGSTVKSGAKAGITKNPLQVTTLTGILDPEFKSLPRLLKLQLCQVWVFHPTIRHNLSLTDIANPDKHPEPLVSTDILAPIQQSNQSPWDV